MEVRLCVKDWEHTSHIHAEELVRRLLCAFPGATVDREKGNAHVQERLDRLIDTRAPDVILESHRSHFNNVIYVSISKNCWGGASATSYLYSIWPPLGDRVHFEVADANDAAAVAMITNELKAAMDMVLCSDLTESESM